MMLYHRKCGNQIYLDISGAFAVYAVVGLSSQRLSAGPCDITVKDGIEITPSFYCRNCGVSVDVANIYITCSYCGDRVSLTDAKVISGSGGIYCSTHGDSMATENDRRVLRFVEILANKIRLQR